MDKKENLELCRQHILRGETKLKSLPLVIYFEVTNRCNLRCPMCAITMNVEGFIGKRGDLEYSLFEKVKPYLKLAERCFCNGGGEPLLYPGFIPMLREIKESGPEIVFNSNGLLLTKETSRELVLHNIDCVSFSIDGANKATYEKIRVGSNFDKVISNIKYLAITKKKKRKIKPFINLQMTLSQENREEIVDIIPLAKTLGTNHVVIEPLTPVFNISKEYQRYFTGHYVDRDDILPELESARDTAERAGFHFSSHYLSEQEKTNQCLQPWITLGIRADGDVFTCCGAPVTFGNIANSSLEEIWNGEEYCKLREAFSKGIPPDVCRLCLEENRANHYNSNLLKSTEADKKAESLPMR
ncbi:MAG: radical SAM protein [Deltaproteobacteria bacterium]|nr:MAG: radical SAM protein [Deltaproteobacteria bacterium]